MAKHYNVSFYLRKLVCKLSTYNNKIFQNIDQLITMRSSDGSVVEILTSMENDFDDFWLSKRGALLSMEIYYPGQEVVCFKLNVLYIPTLIKYVLSFSKGLCSCKFCPAHLD